MTDQQIIAIKKSWVIFRNLDPLLVGDVFYSRLFLRSPGLKKMFPASMNGQYKKIVDMLNLVVARLERMEELAAEVEELGRRHAGWGVKPWHYVLVGEALLWTLEHGLGRDWNPPLSEAWTCCYQEISGLMLAATGVTNPVQNCKE